MGLGKEDGVSSLLHKPVNLIKPFSAESFRFMQWQEKSCSIVNFKVIMLL